MRDNEAKRGGFGRRALFQAQLLRVRPPCLISKMDTRSSAPHPCSADKCPLSIHPAPSSLGIDLVEANVCNIATTLGVGTLSSFTVAKVTKIRLLSIPPDWLFLSSSYFEVYYGLPQMPVQFNLNRPGRDTSLSQHPSYDEPSTHCALPGYLRVRGLRLVGVLNPLLLAFCGLAAFTAPGSGSSRGEH
jgi:hypothetical protein